MNDTYMYGQFELDKNALLKYLLSNADSYIRYKGYNEEQLARFNNNLSYIMEGILDGTISANGLGKFLENGQELESGDTSEYVHTVANAMGKKFGSVKKKNKEKKEEETPEQEMFDYNKHGLSYGFNRKYNPFGTDTTYDLWKSGFKSQEDLNNSLLDYIGLHKTTIQNSNYDFSKSLIDKDSYINMLTDLENDIRTDGIKDSDQSKLKFLGLNPSNFILPIKEEKQGFLGEGNKTGDPFGHIALQTGLSEEEQKIQVEKEAKEIAQMPFSEYFGQEWTESDKLRLKSIGYDLFSVFDPEPITAAAAGFRSDYLNQKADELEGGSFGWDDIANYAMSAVGAIPIFGDAVKGANMIRRIQKIKKPLIAALAGGTVFSAYENGEEIYKSFMNILDGNYGNVQDWRNISTGLLLLLGFGNAYKSHKALNVNLENLKNAKDALVVSVNNKGKKENLQFTGEDAEALKLLLNDPEKFKLYLKDNFEGLDDVELSNVKTDREWTIHNDKGSLTLPTKKVKLQTVLTKTKAYDGKQNTGSLWTKRSKWYETYLNDAAVSANSPTKKLKPVETKLESKQETPKTESSEAPKQEESIIKLQAETQKLESPKEQSKTTTKEPAKTEEKPDFSKAREVVNEKKSESVKATEIEPDNKSKATEAANTQSEVAKSTPASLKLKLKNFNKGKGSKKKNKEIDDLFARIEAMQTNSNRQQLARDVAKNEKLASKEYISLKEKLINSGYNDQDAKKALAVAGIYKEGGILKALDGIKAPDWYKARYGNRTKLLGWDRTKGSQNWTTDEHTFHGNADSLDSVFKANLAYITEKGYVGDDIRNYYNLNLYANLLDFVNKYNDDAKAIRDFWNKDHTYNENTAQTHNLLFKKMFASRSATIDGNNAFNLNYQDDIEPIVGSTTWHRRMDLYEKKWDLLSDEEKRTRMHEITLADGTSGWVYKKANGDIDILDNTEAERILNLKEPVIPDTGKAKGVYNDEHTPPPPVVKIPKPEKPNDSFFTPDKALAFVNYFRALRNNLRILDIANESTPLLYDPVEHNRSVYGNLRAIAEGNRQAAEITSKASRPLTSDGNLQTAAQMDAYNQGLQYINRGLKADDEMMRQTAETAWLQQKENKENRYNIAMKNRENMHQVNAEKLLEKATKTRSDYESGTNMIDEIRTWLITKQKADSDKANLLYSRRLLEYVQNNPDKYIPNWKLYENLWDRYNNGELLTANELRTIQQILSRLADAYYNEIYGKDDYFGYGINNPNWGEKDIVFKQGGKLTKSQVDTVIKFLKESNNNYNKAVDRSVRGLYNHIKLLRKK